MKHEKKELRFVDVVATVAKFCAAIIVVGLIVPALRPYAFIVGSTFGVVMAAGLVGVLIYAGCRFAAYSLRPFPPARIRSVQVPPSAAPGAEGPERRIHATEPT